MTAPIHLAVVGVGKMGEVHCRVVSQIKAFRLVGVYDPDADRGRHVAELYDTRYFASLEELLRGVDAVVIAAPTAAHADLADIALTARVHVLIEKPIAATVEDGRRVVQSARQSERVCLVGHTERYNGAFRELQNVLAGAGPLSIRMQRLSSSPDRSGDLDVILDLMIHDIDLLLYLVGEEPGSMSATGLRMRSDRLDHVDALFAFPGGSIAALTASRVTESKIRRIEVTAPGRYVTADLLSRQLTIQRGALPQFEPAGDGVKFRLDSVTQQVQVPAAEPLALELADFAAAIREGRSPSITVEDGLRALSLALRVQEQAERNPGR